jgi:hypothetical protein
MQQKKGRNPGNYGFLDGAASFAADFLGAARFPWTAPPTPRQAQSKRSYRKKKNTNRCGDLICLLHFIILHFRTHILVCKIHHAELWLKCFLLQFVKCKTMVPGTSVYSFQKTEKTYSKLCP